MPLVARPTQQNRYNGVETPEEFDRVVRINSELGFIVLKSFLLPVQFC